MGNGDVGDGRRQEENNAQQNTNNARQNLQGSRYAPLLGSMLGGSLLALVAIYNLIKESSDVVKLVVLGGVTLGVFAVASGLAATSLGNTEGTARYAKYAALAAVTIVLCLFLGGLCSLFVSPWYKVGCAVVFGGLICFLDIAWLYMDR